jgi:hypothetical protein
VGKTAVRRITLFVQGLGTLLVLGAFGCATPYQQSGFRGGYQDAQIDSNTASVTFHGNAYTSKQRVQLALMYRCAQVTLQDGFDYFLIVNSDTEAKQGIHQTAVQYVSNTSGSAMGMGNMAFGSAMTTGTYYPVHTYTTTKFGSEAVIKMFKGQKPQDDPNAFDAHDVVAHLGPDMEPAVK